MLFLILTSLFFFFSSSSRIGRINVAHAHKKKRLDSEFERLLSQIEAKRDGLQVTTTDPRTPIVDPLTDSPYMILVHILLEPLMDILIHVL